MTPERVPPLERDAAHTAAEAVHVPDFVADINVFRVLLQHPPLARCLNQLLGPLLINGTLDARMRELVIMRVAWVTGSWYEWGQHWKLGQDFGAPAEDLAAVRDWVHSDRFDATDQAVLRATDETLAGHALPDATWADLTGHLPREQCMELLMLIGGYQMLSGVLRTLGVVLDDGIDLWPPDGRAPGA
ncbi:MAG TPA: carboxymuconolactone decarboxylase family protein [Acidimicrobiia bacterium]